MKTNENQKSTNHSPTAQKPFFGAGTEHAFFSAERAPSTPFFQPKAVWQPTQQAKSAISEAEGITQPLVQRMPAFESELIAQRAEQRSLLNSPQQLSASPIQAKLTIGQPGDKYEQEADRVASQVVEQINAPPSAQSTQGRSVQRQEEKPEELQAKPEITILQRQEEKPEELQAKSTQQRAIAGGEASSDLTSAINSARGGGQAIADNIREPMEQSFGADFSGVKVHTDGQSDHLNRSIQARAFTTGQDVFFRQGEYNPGSRGGQELIAHELTHVVQQNGGAVQRSLIQRVMTQDELKSNATVQGLKPKVDELENHINLGTLNTLSLSKLQELKDAIDKSIKERGKLKSLGSDPGHIKRIEVEVNMQNELQGVIEQKQKQAQKDKMDSDNQKLKDAPSLLASGSTWGKKK